MDLNLNCCLSLGQSLISYALCYCRSNRNKTCVVTSSSVLVLSFLNTDEIILFLHIVITTIGV